MAKILTSLILLAGCARSLAAPLTPQDVNANPDPYDGAEVSVEGYLMLSPEGHVLYQSKDLSRKFAEGIRSGRVEFDPSAYKIYCLTVINSAFLDKQSDLFNHRQLIFKGRFVKNYLDGHRVDLGACPLPTGLVVDEQDFLSRYGPAATRHAP